MFKRRSLVPHSRSHLLNGVRPRFGSPWTAITIAALATIGYQAAADAATRTKPSQVSRRWTIVKRTQTQDQGDWQVDYRIKLDSPSAARLEPSDLALTVRGDLSNSRVPSHAFSRPVSASLNEKLGTNVLTDVIPSTNDLVRCRERLVARFWAEGEGESQGPIPIAPHPPLSSSAVPLFEPMLGVTVPAGGMLHVRFRLEHDHFLHGPYDPLLGRRDVELCLGADVLRDAVPLNREQYLAQSRAPWTDPPEDRRDTRRFVSAPDSLYLEAHIPGNESYRFTEKPVRYATKMRLSFWYLIAVGTERDFRLQVTQYKDSPNGWQILHAGMIEKTYKTTGRWVKVEQVFRTEPQATSMALTYRIVGAGDVGEVWIDDVRLEPVEGTGDRP